MLFKILLKKYYSLHTYTRLNRHITDLTNIEFAIDKKYPTVPICSHVHKQSWKSIKQSTTHWQNNLETSRLITRRTIRY